MPFLVFQRKYGNGHGGRRVQNQRSIRGGNSRDRIFREKTAPCAILPAKQDTPRTVPSGAHAGGYSYRKEHLPWQRMDMDINSLIEKFMVSATVLIYNTCIRYCVYGISRLIPLSFFYISDNALMIKFIYIWISFSTCKT